MTPQEAKLFNFYMSLVLLMKAQEAIKNDDKEKLKRISKLGIIYVNLCLIY